MTLARDAWHEIWKAQEARRAEEKRIPLRVRCISLNGDKSVVNTTTLAVEVDSMDLYAIPTLTETVSAGGCAPPIVASQSKYRNKPTDGYASIKEAKRAFQLKLLRDQGVISDLREQVSYLLIPKQDGERACHYLADFVYRDAHGHETVEDVKSPASKTQSYRIKKKLMLFVHAIRIVEV